MLTGTKLKNDIEKGFSKMISRTDPCENCNYEKYHFHGSDIGKCRLQTHYKKNDSKEQIDLELGLFFLDGHISEKMVIEALREEGYNIIAGREFIHIAQISIDYFSRYLNAIGYPLELKKQLMYIAQEINFVQIIGHTDGIIEYNGEKFILELKAVGKTAFANFNRGIYYPWYKGQIQCYLNCESINNGFLIAKCRENGAISNPIPFYKDSNYFNSWCCELLIVQLANELKNKSKDKSFIPPIDRPHQTPNDLECKFCNYKEECWR